jgi:serine/threonine-protein kinase
MHPVALEPGSQVGDFVVLSVLGEGATGIVYEAKPVGAARDLATPSGRVALKVLHPLLCSEPQTRGRFFREMKILSQLRSKNIPELLRWGAVPRDSATEVLFCAQQLVKGPTLKQAWSQADADSKPADVVRVLRQICGALVDAHAIGVVHRDLKPDNVLLAEDEQVFVIDFGMAKIAVSTGDGSGTTHLTKDNMVFGTPEYMAPEQARGETVDPRTDVYAVGALLYEWLTGRPPFEGETPVRVLKNVLEGELVTPDEGPRCTPALRAIALHALARNPERRYASAKDIDDALRVALEQPNHADAVRPARFADARAQIDAHSATLPQISAMTSTPAPSMTELGDVHVTRSSGPPAEDPSAPASASLAGSPGSPAASLAAPTSSPRSGRSTPNSSSPPSQSSQGPNITGAQLAAQRAAARAAQARIRMMWIVAAIAAAVVGAVLAWRLP